MTWALLAIGSAALQAVGLAIKKHALRVGGTNDLVAFFVFVTAGVAMAGAFMAMSGSFVDSAVVPVADNVRFWGDIFIAIAFSVIGVLFSYKALDMADLSYLSPYSVFGLFITMAVAFVLFGELPTVAQGVGIGIVIVGSLVMEYRAHAQANAAGRAVIERNRAAMMYFFLSVAAYSVPPAFQKSAVLAADPLFVGWTIHIGMAVCFLVIAFARGNFARIVDVRTVTTVRRFVLWTALAGLIAALGNGAMYYALTDGPVAAASALKRLMPIFTFLIGFYVFHEHTNVVRRSVATVLIVIGAVLIALG